MKINMNSVRFPTILRVIIIFLTGLPVIYLIKWQLTDNAPNTVHYVIFKKSSLDFITFLSMTSVIKVQKPKFIKIHTNSSNTWTGPYSKLIDDLAKIFDVKIILKLCYVPTHINGRKLGSVYHSSEVKRLSVLYEEGGIYLDTDLLVLKPLDNFFIFKTALACPEHGGNQIILAEKRSPFIHLWLQTYKLYEPKSWYKNGRRYLKVLLNENPERVLNLTEEFGSHNLIKEIYSQNKWNGWKSLYAIHLFISHDPAYQFVNASYIFRNAFGDILNFVLYQIKPSLQYDRWGAMTDVTV